MHPRDRRPANGVNRRDFLKRSAAAAVAMPSMAAILNACKREGGPTGGPGQYAVGDYTGYQPAGAAYPLPRPDKPVRWWIPEDNQPIASGLKPEKNTKLSVYNWTDYIYPDALFAFQEKYGVEVEVTNFNNMEEAMTKILAGKLKFDIFFPTVDVLGQLIVKKLLQPLNHDYMPNFAANVWDEPGLAGSNFFKSPYYDMAGDSGFSQYSVPYTVYNTGMLYRRDKVSDEEFRQKNNPYDWLWDTGTPLKVTAAYDSMPDAMGTAMLRRGNTDLGTEDDTIIKQAGDDLVALQENRKPKWGVEVAYVDFPQVGRIDISQAWGGDAVATWDYWPGPPGDYDNSGFWYPEDRKGCVGSDLIAIPSNAENPVLAHLFLDYMYQAENAMKNYSWNCYQPAIKQADPDTLTTTFGYFNEVDGFFTESFPGAVKGTSEVQNGQDGYVVPYVFPWLTDAIVRPSDFAGGYQLVELPPDTYDKWQAQWQRARSAS